MNDGSHQLPLWLVQSSGFSAAALAASRVDTGAAARARAALLMSPRPLSTLLPEDRDEARIVVRQLADFGGPESNPQDPLTKVLAAVATPPAPREVEKQRLARFNPALDPNVATDEDEELREWKLRMATTNWVAQKTRTGPGWSDDMTPMVDPLPVTDEALREWVAEGRVDNVTPFRYRDPELRKRDDEGHVAAASPFPSRTQVGSTEKVQPPEWVRRVTVPVSLPQSTHDATWHSDVERQEASNTLRQHLANGITHTPTMHVRDTRPKVAEPEPYHFADVPSTVPKDVIQALIGDYSHQAQLSSRRLRPHEKTNSYFATTRREASGAEVVRRMHPALDGRVDSTKMVSWINATTTSAPFGSVGHGAAGQETLAALPPPGFKRNATPTTPSRTLSTHGIPMDYVAAPSALRIKVATSATAAKRVTWQVTPQ